MQINFPITHVPDNLSGGVDGGPPHPVFDNLTDEQKTNPDTDYKETASGAPAALMFHLPRYLCALGGLCPTLQPQLT